MTFVGEGRGDWLRCRPWFVRARDFLPDTAQRWSTELLLLSLLLTIASTECIQLRHLDQLSDGSKSCACVLCCFRQCGRCQDFFATLLSCVKIAVIIASEVLVTLFISVPAVAMTTALLLYWSFMYRWALFAQWFVCLHLSEHLP